MVVSRAVGESDVAVWIDAAVMLVVVKVAGIMVELWPRLIGEPRLIDKKTFEYNLQVLPRAPQTSPELP